MMLDLLWLVPALPLAGFLVLVLGRGSLPRPVVAAVGVGSVGAAALVALLVAIAFLSAPPPGSAYTQVLWTWMNVGGFAPRAALYLDPLSLVMMLVITIVGFLIHLYSSEFMADDEGYGRFFAYMNLFVAAMLVLVLADDLLFLYLGWEGVGLCSYLLIGFWYQDPVNGYAARKAFVVTRVGDTALIIGLFLLFATLGTLDIQELMQRAAEQWPPASGLAVAAAALLLGGALGKSAQLPLQTWLPDAMAGPTPVSALIHAATMVTAGVYLIARTHVLFELAPIVQSAVAIIGTLTLLLAGFSALAQSDIKRILAYSTISQIGYMFLALGAGAWSAAILHFMTHAFFKALLFLAAGAVILSLHHEHDIFRMGGLKERLPVVYWSFLIGSASLASLPLVTAGFYSKEMILWETWASGSAGGVLWAAGLIGAFITAVYIFRAVFIVFFGEAKTAIGHRPGYVMTVPLVVLSVLSIIGGFVEIPPSLGHVPLFSELLAPTLPHDAAPEPATGTQLMLLLAASAASLLGIYVAYRRFLRGARPLEAAAGAPAATALQRLWFEGWGFDRLYDRLFVRPFMRTAQANRNDVVDAFYEGVALANRSLHHLLSWTQTGRVRWYAAGIAAGAAGVVALAVYG